MKANKRVPHRVLVFGQAVGFNIQDQMFRVRVLRGAVFKDLEMISNPKINPEPSYPASKFKFSECI